MAVGLLLLELGAGEGDLVGVDDDDEVAGVDVRGEGRLVLAAQEDGGLAREAAEHDVGRVDDVPRARDLARLRGVGTHQVSWVVEDGGTGVCRVLPRGTDGPAEGARHNSGQVYGAGAAPQIAPPDGSHIRADLRRHTVHRIHAHLLCKESVHRYCAHHGHTHPRTCSVETSGDLTGIRLDATSLRVLAHPLRSRLLSQLRIGGPATATDLAAELGTNSGATSYHLRKLESVGLVADTGEGEGKRRLWRAATDFHSYYPSDFVGDEDSETALNWLARDYVRHFSEQAERWVDVSPLAGGLAGRLREQRRHGAASRPSS